ncbi:MFS transporter [Xylanibacter rodentium]|uniref:Lysosomal dipeptide transporter MFSD1 n=1 Tax=Xylanibacter rodentium TaxID=2736289 RepID=A0ABX2AVY3_9BACT|nr:MFS transporter [Xylanibacter rodentium]NPE14829.1 MFS transporter [Xylanibacter rodentium]
MTETIQKRINDSKAMRWTALILIALMMFFGYMFVDVMSPLQSLVEQERGWSPSVFGTYAASEYLLNVFGFLIIAGVILDKCGIRFTGELSASMMFIGAAIKFYAVSDWFPGTGLATWLDSWWITMPASAKLASFGFMIFGCGCEMAGTTVSKAIAKWFKGKEMALAMGLEMAIARVGVFAIFSISPILAEKMGSIAAPVGFCTALVFIGLITYTVFTFMDRKLDAQLGADGSNETSDEEFKVADLKNILTSQIFWVVALLCVLYYSAIFPFQRYGANMLQCNLDGISPAAASNIFRWFPIGAAVITPFLGSFLDHKGKGATMLMWGAILLIACHLIFAFVLPATHSHVIAYSTIVLLGISFALVPAALWPSVPKIIDEKVLGSAYCLIFWVQNIGLCFVPMLIGSVLASSNANNPAVIAAKEAGDEFIPYNYTMPLVIFACFGVAALILAIYLKAIDRKNHFGLEEPNIKA